MAPLTKNTRAYQLVKWGTVAAIFFLIVLLGVVVLTNWLDASYFSVVYLFLLIISAVKHKGNLYVTSNGIILHGKYYST